MSAAETVAALAALGFSETAARALIAEAEAGTVTGAAACLIRYALGSDATPRPS